MTKYHLYIQLPMPRLHLIFFGKKCLRLVLWLRKRKHLYCHLFIQEELPWEELR